MSPIVLLTMVVGVTAAVWAVDGVLRHRRKSALRRLAGEWHMGYAERDLFNLGGRIVGEFPVPAAGALRVVDVIYGSQQDRHRYLFTAQYTRGVVGGRRREQWVMTFCEPQDAAQGQCCSPLIAAPEQLSILDQYRHLHDHEVSSATSRASAAPGAASGSSPAS